MTEQQALEIIESSLIISLKLAGPILISTLVVGIIISVFQAITQINEATLTFIPKILLVGFILYFFGSWMLGQISSYSVEIFSNIPELIRYE